MLSVETWGDNAVGIKEISTKFLCLSGNAFGIPRLVHFNIHSGKACSSRKAQALTGTTVGSSSNSMFRKPRHTQSRATGLNWNERRMSPQLLLPWFHTELSTLHWHWLLVCSSREILSDFQAPVPQSCSRSLGKKVETIWFFQFLSIFIFKQLWGNL